METKLNTIPHKKPLLPKLKMASSCKRRPHHHDHGEDQHHHHRHHEHHDNDDQQHRCSNNGNRFTTSSRLMHFHINSSRLTWAAAVFMFVAVLLMPRKYLLYEVNMKQKIQKKLKNIKYKMQH